jgi:hypothetical protein
MEFRKEEEIPTCRDIHEKYIPTTFLTGGSELFLDLSSAELPPGVNALIQTCPDALRSHACLSWKRLASSQRIPFSNFLASRRCKQGD